MKPNDMKKNPKASCAGNVFELGVDAGICHVLALGNKNKNWKKIFEYTNCLGKWSMSESRKMFLGMFSKEQSEKEQNHHAKIFTEGFLSGVSYADRLVEHLKTSGKHMQISVDFLHMNIGELGASVYGACRNNASAESKTWFGDEDIYSLIERFIESGHTPMKEKEPCWAKGEWWQSDFLAVFSLFNGDKRERRVLVVGDMNHKFIPFMSLREIVSETPEGERSLVSFGGNHTLSTEGMLKEMCAINSIKSSESVWNNVFVERILDEDRTSTHFNFGAKKQNDELIKLLSAIKSLDTSSMKIIQSASYAGSFLDFVETVAPFSKFLSEDPFNIDEVFCSSISQWGTKTAVIHPSIPIDMEFVKMSRLMHSTSGKGGDRRDVVNYVIGKLAPLLPLGGAKAISSFADKLGDVVDSAGNVSRFGDDEKTVIERFKDTAKELGLFLSKDLKENELVITESLEGKFYEKSTPVILKDNEYFTTDSKMRNVHGEMMLNELRDDSVDILFLIGHPGIGKTYSLKKYISDTVKEGKRLGLLSLVPRKILGENTFERKTWEELGADIVSVNAYADLITSSIKEEEKQKGILACARYDSKERMPELEQAALRPLRKDDGKTILCPIKLIHSDEVGQTTDSGRDDVYKHLKDSYYSVKVCLGSVMDCLMNGTERVREYFSEELQKPDVIISCATLQAIVKKGGRKTIAKRNSMDEILPQFFGIEMNGEIGEQQPTYEGTKKLAKDYPVMVLFVDEITGAEEGAATLHSISSFLRKHKKELLKIGMVVKVVIADASLVGAKSVRDFLKNPAFESRILHIKETTQKGVAISPLSVVREDIGGNGIAKEPLRCSIIDCNAFPAINLKITYRIPVPIVAMDFPNAWSAQEGKTECVRQISDMLNRTIISIVNNFLENSDAHEQIIVYVQDKKHLDVMSGKIAEECKIPRKSILTLHSKVDKSGLTQDKINSFKVVLMTSTANRGVSFQNATKIVFQTPDFSPEEQLAEIIQLVFRGRGQDIEKGGLIPDSERRMSIEALLPGKVMRIPYYSFAANLFAKSDEESQDIEHPRDILKSSISAIYCSTIFEVLEQVALIRLSILTRIKGGVKERSQNDQPIRRFRPSWEKDDDSETLHLLIPVAKQFLGDKNVAFEPRKIIHDFRRSIKDVSYVMQGDYKESLEARVENLCGIMNSARIRIEGHTEEAKRAEETMKQIFKQITSYSPKNIGEMLKLSVNQSTGTSFASSKQGWFICNIEKLLKSLINYSCGIAYFECGKTKITYKIAEKEAREGARIVNEILRERIVQGISGNESSSKRVSAQTAMENLMNLRNFFKAMLIGETPKRFEEDVNVVIGFPVSGLLLDDGDIRRYSAVMKLADAEYSDDHIVRSMRYLSSTGGAGFSFDESAINPLNDMFGYDTKPYFVFYPGNIKVVRYKEFANKGYSVSGLLNIMQLFSQSLVKWNSE